jgi:diphosphomevalonate decarboxylase
MLIVPSQLSSWPLRIASYNNFPTAAGLASSASGLAALVASLAQLYELPQTPSELSRIARQGSGSACRSLFGGFVAWREGTSPDGSDSLAEEVAPKEHWPEMHALICVVSDAKKGTSSTAGMQRTVETSPLLQHRLKIVPGRMDEISRAIREKDFDDFAKITMADSNQFHAVCLDTAPPIFYLNDVSRSLIALVEEMNRTSLASTGHLIAAYTFDAGPNCVIYALKPAMPSIIATVSRFFPQEGPFPDPFGLFEGKSIDETQLPEGFNAGVISAGGWEKGAVKSLIHTRVGDGPRRLGKEESLLKEDGTPKALA